jgi:hypothetical protein
MSEHKCKGTCKKDFTDKTKKDDKTVAPKVPPANDQKPKEPAHKCCGKCKP